MATGALDAPQRQSSVAEAAGSPFFEKIRSSAWFRCTATRWLSPFRYQGEEGDMGYLFKGFDDDLAARPAGGG